MAFDDTTAIISISDVRGIRELDQKFNTTRFSAYELEAKRIQLKQLLGDALYYDLFTNITDAKYITLIAGESYTNSDGDTAQFFGLKPFLTYAWLAVYTNEGNQFQTRIGNREFVQNTNQKAGGNWNNNKLFKENMIDFANNIIDYLNQKESTYSLWIGKGKSKT